MEELFKAIYTKFTASSSGHTSIYSDVSGQFYLDEAPQSSASTSLNMPYVVYNLISLVREDTFTNQGEDAVIQFNLFSNTAAATEVTTMFKHLAALYDWCDLSISGYNHIYMRRELSYLRRVNSAWHYAVEYRTYFSK